MRRAMSFTAALAAFLLVPNGPHRAWYSLAEIACGWFEDQWQCDLEPVGFERHRTAMASAQMQDGGPSASALVGG